MPRGVYDRSARLASKKSAKKTTAKATKRAVKAADSGNTEGSPSLRVELPAGYEVITGSFANKWDMEAMPVLEGVVTRKDTLDVGKGRNKRAADVMEIETAEGKFSVWKSASLASFFDSAQIGSEVALAYRGEKKIAGQRNPMHDITAGVKPTEAPARKARKA